MVEVSSPDGRKAEGDVVGDGVTRREALVRFALMAGGAAFMGNSASALAGSLPGVSAAGVAGAAAPSVAAGFNARRRKVFQALLECFDGRSPIAVTAGRDLAAEMVERYATKGEQFGQYVDALLDAVDSAPEGTRFADQGLIARQATLLEWRAAHDSNDDLRFQGRRPSDSEGPTDIRERNEWMAAKIKKHMATLSPEDMEIDPKTLMPRIVGRAPTPPMPKVPTCGPIGTPVLLRRSLERSSYLMLAGLFVDDPLTMRHL